MKNDKCPYCYRSNCVIDKVYLNAEIYGNQLFTVPCAHCGKLISISIERSVRVITISRSHKKMEETETNRECYYYNWGGDIEKGYPLYPREYGARCEKNGEFFTVPDPGVLTPNCFKCFQGERDK